MSRRRTVLGFSLVGVAWLASAVGCATSSDDPGGTPGCGNGVVEMGEICDDGNTINGDGCSAGCLQERGVCGNGKLDPGEICDDGNINSGDGCSARCLRESASNCGNGAMDPGEQCDDGNMSNTDTCLNSCIPARCGDGNVLAGTEQCDSGAANSNSSPGACRLNCMTPTCGDGVKDLGMPYMETCDDGNNIPSDGCSATCVREPRCGDGVVDPPGEICDDGNLSAGDGCDGNCRKEPRCGDFALDSGEGCDDGNLLAGDGCTAMCQPETGHFFEVEQNGAVAMANASGAPGVQIHGALNPAGDNDYFSFTLTRASDVRIETFDAGGPNSCASGDTKLELIGTNGTTVLATDDDDGAGACSLIDPLAPVSPDTGARALPPGTYTIRVQEFGDNDPISAYRVMVTVVASCGDGLVQGAEQCDDMNNAPGDGCSAICQWEPVCGNRRIEITEQCDDGNVLNNDGCSSICRYEVVNENENNDMPSRANALGAPNKLAKGSIMPATDEDFYTFTLSARADIKLETFDENGPSTCASIDTEIQLRGTNGTTVLVSDDDDGVGNCSMIDASVDSAARGLAPGTYYVRVIRYAMTTTITNYHLSVQIVGICGNNIKEPSELCDDGNTIDGDGCTSQCSLEPVTEVEPNDDGMVMVGSGSSGNDFSAMRANGPFMVDTLIAGAINPVGDEDVFAITNPTSAPIMLKLETFGASVATCTGMDTYLHVRNMAGTSLASDDDSGPDNCSKLMYSVPAMTTVYAHVMDFGDTDLIARYSLFIDFP